MAVLVLQLLVSSFEYVLFAYFAVWARSCPYLEGQLVYPTVHMECSPL